MDAPPKMLKQHMEKHRELVQSTASLVISRLGLAGASGPAPVPQALRDFLEIESRKARRRTVLLTTFFAAFLLLIMGAGGFLALVYVREMQKDFRDVQGHVATFESLSEGLKKDTQATLAGFEQRASKVQEDIEARHRALIKAGTDSQSASQDQAARLQKMSDLLAAVDARNEKLQKDLEGMKAEWPLAARSPKAGAAAPAAPADPRAVPAEPASAPRPADATLLVSLSRLPATRRR